jgi:hypothetical protein
MSVDALMSSSDECETSWNATPSKESDSRWNLGTTRLQARHQGAVIKIATRACFVTAASNSAAVSSWERGFERSTVPARQRGVLAGVDEKAIADVAKRTPRSAPWGSPTPIVF